MMGEGALSQPMQESLSPDGNLAGATLAEISVVIPCYDQGRFLDEAIRSVLRQGGREVEIVVVDDGSTDVTAEVAARYPQVRYVQQENQGLSAARNTGIRHSGGKYLVFLDADDRLLPGALDVGKRALDANPGCGFVSGHFRLIAEDGSYLEQPKQITLRGTGYHQLLRGNYIGMHATVMYRRSALEAVGGFDRSLQSCEDYDIYFRITRLFPVTQHSHPVAEYRQHGANMSRDLSWMLASALGVLRRYGRSSPDPLARHALRQGERAFRAHYAQKAAKYAREQIACGQYGAALLVLVKMAEADGVRMLPMIGSSLLGIPTLSTMKLKRVWERARRRLNRAPAKGRVRFGHLRRLQPLDASFGFGRGLPVDRYYIERFLGQNATDVRGRVLEVGDDAYTRRFGGSKVVQADILHVDETNPRATIIADLSDADHLAVEAFDCVIMTQTLQLVYDVKAALRTLQRILRPGGVLLVTVPGISQVSDPTWRGSWYWSFTPLSVKRLLEDAFPGAGISVEANGNVLAASAFLYGLAADELRQEELDALDPNYPMLITARVVKPEARA